MQRPLPDRLQASPSPTKSALKRIPDIGHSSNKKQLRFDESCEKKVPAFKSPQKVRRQTHLINQSANFCVDSAKAPKLMHQHTDQEWNEYMRNLFQTSKQLDSAPQIDQFLGEGFSKLNLEGDQGGFLAFGSAKSLSSQLKPGDNNPSSSEHGTPHFLNVYSEPGAPHSLNVYSEPGTPHSLNVSKNGQSYMTFRPEMDDQLR